MSIYRTAAAVAVAFALTACAGPRATTSGFLADYSALEQSAEKTHVRAKASDAATLAAYKAVYLAPPEMRAEGLSPEQAAAVLGDLSQALEAEFGTFWQLAEAPGAGVMTVRTAVTHVKKSNVALNVATTAILGPVDFGTLSIEGEAVDGGTSAPLAAIAWAKSSGINETLETFTPTGSARALTPVFARDFVALLGKAEEQKRRDAEAQRREDEEQAERDR